MAVSSAVVRTQLNGDQEWSAEPAAFTRQRELSLGTATVSLDELAARPERAAELSPENARMLISRSVIAMAALNARILMAEQRRSSDESRCDRLLEAEEAAARLGMNVDHLYRKANDYPFTVHNGRSVRFSEKGMERWILERQRRRR